VSSESRNAEEHKIFLDERRLQEANSRKVIEQFDKAVMTLAAGGLSISLLFVEKIAPEPRPSTLFWLAGIQHLESFFIGFGNHFPSLKNHF